MRAVARWALEARGYRVLEAAGGEAALDAAAAYPGPIDLLLSDVGMPGLYGPRLAARLAASRPGLRALLMSGSPEDHPTPDGALGRRTAFLAKPFTADSLCAAVRCVLDGAA